MENAEKVGWSSEQALRADKVIDEELARSRIAAKMLPVRQLEPTAKNVVNVELDDVAGTVTDQTYLTLAEPWVALSLDKQQVHDAALSSAIISIRRRANLFARLEDALLFNGYNRGADRLPPNAPQLGDTIGVERGQRHRGLDGTNPARPVGIQWVPPIIRLYRGAAGYGEDLVLAVAEAIEGLAANGHLGPYALFLCTREFVEAHRPSPSLVLPRDRIEPLVEGNLHRASVLEAGHNVLVSLGGDTVDRAVAVQPTLRFFQVNQNDIYQFRIYSVLTLRVKQPLAAVTILYQ